MAFDSDVSEVRAYLDHLEAGDQDWTSSPARAAARAASEKTLNEKHGKADWCLKDIPQTTERVWNKLIDLVGFEDIRVISMHGKIVGEEKLRYGSVLLSPKGHERFERYVEETEERTRKT